MRSGWRKEEGGERPGVDGGKGENWGLKDGTLRNIEERMDEQKDKGWAEMPGR